MTNHRLKTVNLRLLIVLSLVISFIGGQAFASEQGSKPLVSMEFKDADIQNVLRILAKQAGLNMIVGEEIKGKVTVSFVDVTLEEALKQILASQGYVYVKTDNIIRVTVQEKLDMITRTFTLKYANAEEVKVSLGTMLSAKGKVEVDKRTNTLIITDTIRKVEGLVPIIKKLDIKISKEVQLEAEKVKIPTVTRMFVLKYAEAEEIKITLEELKSKEGKVIANKEANAIIVTDTPVNVEKISKYLEELDIEPRQVLIEAKIAEITLDKDTQLGINWQKFDFLILESEVKPGQAYTGGVTTDFALGNTGLTLNVFEQNTDVVLNALTEMTDVDLLSSPKIVTLDHQEAYINVGEKVPYIVSRVEEGVVTETVDWQEVGIKLTVTPHISPNNTVIMDIHPEVSEVKSETVQGYPRIATREATTQVLIRDGQTIAIGGMIKDKRTKSVYRVPILGSIPILGMPFRKTITVINKIELVILITPRILKKGKVEKAAEE
jgi:type II secretory pathway component GspD/PulD (secretin)